MTSHALRMPSPVLRVSSAPRIAPAPRKACRKTAPKPRKRTPVVLNNKDTTSNNNSSASRRHEYAVQPEVLVIDAQSADSECSNLREQLLHALVHRQRQDDELVALRALAKSLKDQVDAIHTQQSHHSAQSHEFFARDLELEQLRMENKQLQTQLGDATREIKTLRAVVERELPQLRLAAVRARAELACVASQLRDEQTHCDCLEAQLARLGAQQRPRTAAARASMSHAREAFLLQCRSSECDSGESKQQTPKHRRHRRSSSPLRASRSSTSSSEIGEVQPLASDSVHRDLARLDHELRALHSALQQ